MSFRRTSRSESVYGLKSPAVAQIQTLVTAWFSKNNQRSTRISRGDQKRAEILWSILASETKYVKQLSTIQKSFFRPMKASHMLAENQLNILFINTRELLELHTDFKAEIVQVVSDWSYLQELGPSFRMLAKNIELYRIYAEKHSDMLQLLQLQLTNTEFQKLLKKKMASGKDLRTLLQAPLQIIPRYAVYIKEYLSYSHKKHVDQIDLPGTLKLFNDMIDIMRIAQRASDDADKIMFIVSNVQDARLSVFSSASQYISECEMQVVNNEDQEVVYGFLFNDVIFFTSEAPKMTRTASMKWTKMFTQNARQKPRFHSCYRTADVVNVYDLGPNMFSLELADRQRVTLQMDSTEKRTEWLKNLKSFVPVLSTGRSMTF